MNGFFWETVSFNYASASGVPALAFLPRVRRVADQTLVRYVAVARLLWPLRVPDHLSRIRQVLLEVQVFHGQQLFGRAAQVFRDVEVSSDFVRLVRSVDLDSLLEVLAAVVAHADVRRSQRSGVDRGRECAFILGVGVVEEVVVFVLVNRAYSLRAVVGVQLGKGNVFGFGFAVLALLAEAFVELGEAVFFDDSLALDLCESGLPSGRARGRRSNCA